jgi:uncharacterized NAD(P)/FAD-binding protein YdhS
MIEEQASNWRIEFDEMRERLRYALNNLDSIEKRTYVKHQIEQVLCRIHELCELNKGESK